MIAHSRAFSIRARRVARIAGAWLAACLAIGCSFKPPAVGETDIDSGPMMIIDGSVDGPQLQVYPYLPSNFEPPGDLFEPTGPIVLDCGESVFDSNLLGYFNWCGQSEPPVRILDQGNGTRVAVISMAGLTVASGSTLRLRGNKPVALAVLGDVRVSGTVDASASGASDGPGVRGCAGDLDGQAFSGTGGGGGGGGFGSGGATGALGEDGGTGGAGGGEIDLPGLSPLRGGCRGGMGARVSGGGTGGVGGGGGGAIQISAAGMLEVTTGGIVASAGGGGGGGSLHDGGGGGGSGGAVLLEGVTVVVASGAALTANGGGGGESGSANSPDMEDNGDPGALDSSDPAVGGTSSGSAGAGGPGGVEGVAPGPGVSGPTQGGDGGGGGGGGGGVGRVRINASTSCAIDAGSVQSPLPTGNGTSGCP